MKPEALAIVLRPRSMVESADLGVRLVQADARSVWRTYAPLHLFVTIVALAGAEASPWLPTLILFWSKPWLDRSLLFVLSRSVFGERTRFADLWRARRTVWLRRFWSPFLVQRFSAWRGYTLPLEQLEGQRGAALRARRRTVLRGQRWQATLVQFAFSNIEFIFVLSMLALFAILLPRSMAPSYVRWVLAADTSGDVLAVVVAFLQYSVVVLLLEPFFVAAGFAMYLGRRVQLEAWDVEQEFRHVFA
jgi:hypothetical protein